MNKLKIMMKRLLVFVCVTALICMSFTVIAYADEKNKKEKEKDHSASAGITIDGYYDDWIDKPMSTITWYSNNGKALHDASMIKDDEYIYIYVEMHPSYQSAIPIDAICLSINNGYEYPMFLRYANAQNTTDWSRNVNLSQNGIYLDLHPFISYPNNSLGDAAVTVSKGHPNDRLEIRINIESLEQAMGLSKGTINSGSQIKLRMPNVGGETIELVGTSTGPVLGLVLCIAMVIAVLWYRSKKARSSH
jgi:uncharacterized protein (TIGR04145 family)